MMTIHGTHDPALVALSIIIASIASYAALDLGGRMRASSGRAASAWLLTSAVALGGGIWSMHFVAMLAFDLPGIRVNYHVGLTILSLVCAIWRDTWTDNDPLAAHAKRFIELKMDEAKRRRATTASSRLRASEQSESSSHFMIFKEPRPTRACWRRFPPWSATVQTSRRSHACLVKVGMS